jgi:CDP-6-deoxy-D-xylo-4-hexulose-3-dehydrase
MSKEEAARAVLDSVKEYYRTFMRRPPYRDGDRIPYASRVFDEREMMNLVDSALEFWLTSGRYTDKFEKDFAAYLGVPFCSLVNSGSSANLLDEEFAGTIG